MREADIIRTIGEQGEGDILNRQIGKFCLNIWVIDPGPQPFRWGISMSASCRAGNQQVGITSWLVHYLSNATKQFAI